MLSSKPPLPPGVYGITEVDLPIRREDTLVRLDTVKPPRLAATTTGWRAHSWRILRTHLAFIGPGVIASIGYMDPGNWATDLQAGSGFGYSHLFIILLSGLISLLFQVMATYLGCITGHDLAVQCRIAFYDRPRHKLLFRYGLLYPLYALTEIGVVFTDLAELLGSAIAINLLVPKIPLWACVLLTSLDVLIILAMFSDYPLKLVTRKMRIFEFSVGLLVLVVLGVFVALIVKVSPDWRNVFHGFVPGPGIVDNGGLYIAVGILGATCMPHCFFIGSSMATMRRLAPEEYGEAAEEQSSSKGISSSSDNKSFPLKELIATSTSSSTPTLIFPSVPLGLYQESPVIKGRLQKNWHHLRSFVQPKAGHPGTTKPEFAPRPTLACVQAHLRHAVWDVVGSLLGFAITINSAILILAAAVFYYGAGKSSDPTGGVADLFDAFDLVKQYLGQASAYLFAIGLLAAGQSSSITVTLSGQIISEGFINWRTRPWVRRLVTRLIGIVPSVIVAAAVGRSGVDVLLVGSQVALSIVLPFVIAPLVIFTSSQSLMSLPIVPPSSVDPSRDLYDVKIDERDPSDYKAGVPSTDLEWLSSTPVLEVESTAFETSWKSLALKAVNPFHRRHAPEGTVCFANGVFKIQLSFLIWVMINIANVYAIYTIAAGVS